MQHKTLDEFATPLFYKYILHCRVSLYNGYKDNSYYKAADHMFIQHGFTGLLPSFEMTRFHFFMSHMVQS